MRRTVYRMMLIAAAVLGGSAGTGLAQPIGYTAMSLEALVAESDVVVRATIAAVTSEPPREESVRLTVTLKVRETLKGESTRAVSFVVGTVKGDKRYEQWRDAGQEQLWFLAHAGGEVGEKGGALSPLGSGWSLIRLGPAVADEKRFSPKPPPIFTMTLDVLEKPEAILKAARAAAAGQKEKQTRTRRIWLPRDVAERSGRSGHINELVVPLDRRLEAMARRMIRSPGDFLGPQHNGKDLFRAEGVKALRHFKSDDNAAILKSLLDDPAWHVRATGGEDGPVIREREYYIRKEAYEALREWGVTVPMPVLREPLPPDDR